MEGDVLDEGKLKEAMAGQDVVYANLAGSLKKMAKSIVKPMNTCGVKRLIWISSMGIYDEVPGQTYNSILDPYRKSAEIIEDSNLDFTILRPGWFTNKNEIDYEITQKGEPSILLFNLSGLVNNGLSTLALFSKLISNLIEMDN